MSAAKWEEQALHLLAAPPKAASQWQNHQSRDARKIAMSELPDDRSVIGSEWSADECSAIVADYFSMLTAELLGTSYNKAEHSRLLRQSLRRSHGSIEFKHANISAVLVEMQMPYIDGYKPRGNYQSLLGDSVAEYLDNHPDLFTSPQVLAAIEPVELVLREVKSTVGVFQEAPDVLLPTPRSTPWLSRRGRRTNFAERDARNRTLGKLGERFTLDVERMKLLEAGRDDLAARVEWIADTCGDGIGFDVLSFDEQTDSEKWIEVKTTVLGKYHPFIVTDNELRCSEAEGSRFHLFRVYDFRTNPCIYVLPGALSHQCTLRPSSYVAAPRLR